MSGHYPSGAQRNQLNPVQQQGGPQLGGGAAPYNQPGMGAANMASAAGGPRVSGMGGGSAGAPQPPPSAQPTHSGMLAISHAQHKEVNIVQLARLGQETVQDITSRFQEIFAGLKVIHFNRDSNTEKKVQEYLRTIRLLFKRVRIIYEKCSDGYPQALDYATVESLIPYVGDPNPRGDNTQTEEYRKALQENQELIETVRLKNRQLREVIDRMRIIIWEINTMLTMRRS